MLCLMGALLLTGTTLLVLHVEGVLWTPAKGPQDYGMQYLGAHCNTLSAHGCNPRQLPNYNHEAYQPDTNRFIKITKHDLFVKDAEQRDVVSTAKYLAGSLSVPVFSCYDVPRALPGSS